MPMHGLARQGDFKLTRLDAGGFAALFVPGDEAKACYPYDYEFTVTYRFEPFGLTCEFALRNLGSVPLPWSAGHHFYFTVPWSEGSVRGDYLLRLPATKRFKQDFRTGQLTPGPALLTDENLSNPALIDTIHTGLLRSNEGSCLAKRAAPAMWSSGSVPRKFRLPMRPSSRGPGATMRPITVSSPGWVRRTPPSTNSACTWSRRVKQKSLPSASP